MTDYYVKELNSVSSVIWAARLVNHLREVVKQTSVIERSWRFEGTKSKGCGAILNEEDRLKSWSRDVRILLHAIGGW
jgi:hypothetical protein